MQDKTLHIGPAFYSLVFSTLAAHRLVPHFPVLHCQHVDAGKQNVILILRLSKHQNNVTITCLLS